MWLPSLVVGFMVVFVVNVPFKVVVVCEMVVSSRIILICLFSRGNPSGEVTFPLIVRGNPGYAVFGIETSRVVR